MSEVSPGNGEAKSRGIKEETQPAPSPKQSSPATWGTPRMEVKPDLTAGDRGKREDMNIGNLCFLTPLGHGFLQQASRKLGCSGRLACTSSISGQSELDPLGRVAYLGRALGCLMLGVVWGALAWISFSSFLWAQPHTSSHFMLYRQIRKGGCHSVSRGPTRRKKAAPESVHPRMA